MVTAVRLAAARNLAKAQAAVAARPAETPPANRDR
jgi:hypothetical protein